MDDALDHLALLSRFQDTFLAGLAGADPGAPVPACGGWRVRDLAQHLGYVHHWAAAQARREEDSPVDPAPSDLPAFYAQHAAELRATLGGLDPDSRAWTLIEPDDPASTVRFWHRRQVHETLVHLHDLRAATGSTVDDVAPEVWADTVDELVTVVAPRQVRLGRAEPISLPVALRATDAGRSWVLGDGSPAATASAPARELALLLWGRLEPAEAGVVVDGDAGALSAALGGRITP
ncbi:maleylpyruvate isomerase family mycothiol-dependent enzyme [Cellulosimicrobium protaetiae]|uniref:Maleylpyruvate isomerase family mycothiol-dependent enzyme n=1 Tax=Cellulosimicrobium protaetiae TaxID=2587808 RepID=A0A6M5UID2_9MICO|nr:maleylpyruvate isomerase family mycothiol-dependent enzyme [Cellulosimicrobium protaetiae]QJW36419.1 maleylpyruvate isomerase family mycothiol-dependent enzyme [Cellulosimicrobium protaetiae]